jgi:hypothetical protein
MKTAIITPLKKTGNLTLEVHTGITMNITVVLGVTPHSLPPSSTLKMEALFCSEKSVYFCFTNLHGFTSQATVRRKLNALELCEVQKSYSKAILAFAYMT